jgi:hypothetical protein
MMRYFLQFASHDNVTRHKTIYTIRKMNPEQFGSKTIIVGNRNHDALVNELCNTMKSKYKSLRVHEFENNVYVSDKKSNKYFPSRQNGISVTGNSTNTITDSTAGTEINASTISIAKSKETHPIFIIHVHDYSNLNHSLVSLLYDSNCMVILCIQHYTSVPIHLFDHMLVYQEHLTLYRNNLYSAFGHHTEQEEFFRNFDMLTTDNVCMVFDLKNKNREELYYYKSDSSSGVTK